MANNVKPKFGQVQQAQEQALPPNVVTYEVDGQHIRLSDIDVVNQILDKKTASLVQPHEVIHFLQQCKAQRLNPFVRDAWLIKYDSSSPAQIVTSEASLEKRAEDFPEFAGMQAGVIVLTADGELIEREGTLVLKSRGEELVGGWAVVQRSDRKTPIKATVNFDEYTTGKSIWKQKPGVMIRKCAKAMALREAFPKHNAGLYDADEIRQDQPVQQYRPQANPYQPQQMPQPDVVQADYAEYPEDPQTGEIVEDNPYA